MDSKSSGREKLVGSMNEAEAIMTALRGGEVDAVVGDKNVLLLRLKEAEEKLKQHQEQLEELVKARTLELNQTIEDLKNTIAERDKAIEAEMSSRAAQLEAEEKLRLQRAMAVRADRLRSLGEMAASIAHELSQPLVGIRGTAETVKVALERGWKMEGPEILEDMSTIIGQADRMTFIIEHVRQFSKGAVNVEAVPVCVNDVVKSCMTIGEFNVKKAGLKIKLDLASSLPPVKVVPFNLEEVIINLLTNARDAIVEKMHSDSACPTEILISTSLRKSDAGKSVIISVTDKGAGIAQNVMPHVFTPFFTTKDTDKGTGLGLAICKSIVAKFDGEISIASNPGVGTRVDVALPAM